MLDFNKIVQAASKTFEKFWAFYESYLKKDTFSLNLFSFKSMYGAICKTVLLVTERKVFLSSTMLCDLLRYHAHSVSLKTVSSICPINC